MLIRNAFLAITLSSLMGGCSVTEQDVGLGTDPELGGRAVDGYIARAIVFVDSNENGILEAWESRAFTDGDGYFTYNPLDDVNYCAADTPRSLAIHCLRFPIGLDESLIRVLGGYDITTGEPFKGMMTLRASPNTDVALLNNSSPLTSLLAMMDQDEANALAQSMGHADTLPLLQDFLQRLEEIGDIKDSDQEKEKNRRELTAMALQAHKIVDVLAHYLEGLLSSNKFGDSKSLPEDSTPFVYQAMATVISEQLAALGSLFDLNSFFKTNTSIKAVIEKAAELIEKVVKNDDESVSVNLPTDDVLDNVTYRTAELARLIQRLFSENVVVNEIDLKTNKSLSDKEDIQARLRAIEVVTTLLRKQANITSNSMSEEVKSAIDLAADATYLVSLSSDKVDIQDLASDISVKGSSATADVADYEGRLSIHEQLQGLDQPITQIIDKSAPVKEAFSLNLSEKNETSDSPTAEDDEVDFKFNTDGTLTADINFTDEQSSDFNIKTEPGEPLPGTWEPINDSTMLVNLEVAGVMQPVIVKTDSDGCGYKFDYGGELIKWDGEDECP